MNIFVPVYVDAGLSPTSKSEDIAALINEAIDYQLTNKVLRKLEYEERNKLIQATDFLNWKTRGDEV